MLLYIFKRLALMVPTLFGVLLLTFVVIQFVPGGPVEQYLAEAKSGAGGTSAEGAGLSYRGAQGVDPKRLAQAKALYGFDKPAPERFWQMLVQFARFDLGKSFFQNRDVFDAVVFGQVIRRGQTVAATADDDDVVAFFRLRVAPGAVPVLVSGQRVAQQRPDRVVRHPGLLLHAHAFGFGIERRIHLQPRAATLAQDFNFQLHIRLEAFGRNVALCQ